MKKLFKKIFGKFLKPKIKYNITEKADAIVERDNLRKKVDQLQTKLDATVAKYPIVDINVGDPSPTDKEDRKLYVAAVAGFHKNYLKPKINQMISTTNSILKDIQNERDLDLVLKGSIYAFEELNRWGDVMISEQVSIQIGENPASDIDK